MNTKIIAFSGRKQSGKSTGAEYLLSVLTKLGISTKIYSFADPLKQNICIDILGLTHNQCYGHDDDKNSLTDILWENIPGYIGLLAGRMTAREVMEIIGTGVFRKIKNDVWVQATLRSIEKDNLSIAIIADCRFPNEVNYIRNINGNIIRLTKDLFKSNAEAERALDPDNYDWSNFTAIIDNQNLTIYDKNQQIDLFLRKIGLL